MGQSEPRLSAMMQALLGPAYVAWWTAATIREAQNQPPSRGQSDA